jgi:hypothetical protein
MVLPSIEDGDYRILRRIRDGSVIEFFVTGKRIAGLVVV